jgi:hypothetical protein
LHANLDPVEPIVEILCELAAGHGGFEVGAREYVVYTGRLSHETFRSVRYVRRRDATL